MRKFISGLFLFSASICFSQNTGIRYIGDSLRINEVILGPGGSIILAGNDGDTATVVKCDETGFPLLQRKFSGVDIDPNGGQLNEVSIFADHLLWFQNELVLGGSVYRYPGDPLTSNSSLFITRLDQTLDTISVSTGFGWGTWSSSLTHLIPNATGTGLQGGGHYGSLAGQYSDHSNVDGGCTGFVGGHIQDGDRRGNIAAFIDNTFDIINLIPGPSVLIVTDSTDGLIGSRGFTLYNGGQAQMVSVGPDTTVAVAGQGSIALFNANLDTIWARDPASNISDIHVDDQGRVIVLFGDPNSYAPMSLRRIGTNGTTEWSRTYLTTHALAPKLRYDPNTKGYLIAGNHPIDGTFILRTDSIGMTDSCNVATSPIWNTTPGFQYEPNCSATSNPGSYVLTGKLIRFDDALSYPFPSMNCGELETQKEANGTVFWDINQNKIQDGMEPGLPNYQLDVGPIALTELTDPSGVYRFKPADGAYTIHGQTPPTWFLTTDSSSYSFAFTSTDTLFTGLDFGVAALLDTLLIDASLIESPGPCGSAHQYTLMLTNTGTNILQGRFAFTLDTGFTVISGAGADSIIGNTLYYTLNPLVPFQSAQFLFSAIDPLFGALSPIYHLLNITSVDSSGIATFFPTDSLPYWVSCAYDPNMKEVFPLGEGPNNYIDSTTQTLEYIIHFQNTGNDTAYSVRLHDQLPNPLISTSIQGVGTSHALSSLNVDQGGFLIAEFDNILLPDSNTNEPASKGWLRFTVDLASGLTHNTTIDNSAGIFFDNNPPIITNTASVTIKNCADIYLPYVPSLQFSTASNTFFVSGPNFWDPNNVPTIQVFLNDSLIYGNVGQSFLAVGNGDYHANIIYDGVCEFNTDTIMVLTTQVHEPGAPEQISIYPNPFSESTMIQLSKALNANDSFNVVDMNGRVIRSLKRLGTELLQLERGTLSSGIYLLELRRANNAKVVERLIVE